MKKQPFLSIVFAISLGLLAMTCPLLAVDEGERVNLLPATVTPDVLNAKIKEVESATTLNDEAKAKLVELYRKALSNLEAADANSARYAVFEETRRTAPPQTERIRQEIESAVRIDPMTSLDLNLESSVEQIQQQLKKEQADLAAVDARRADFARQLADEQARPVFIRKRVTEATQEQQETAAALQVPTESDASPTLVQARQWLLETRYAALGTEINMLDQELLSQPMRVDLLEAERDKAAASVDWIGVRVQNLNELVNRKRQLEAERTKVEAEAARREIEGLDPLLVRLAEQNALLGDELQAMADRLGALDTEQAKAEDLARRIEADFNDSRATLDTFGRSEGLGPLLLKQLQSLPDSQVYARKARARAQEIAEVGGRRLLHQEEARRIVDVEQTVTELEVDVDSEITVKLRDKLRELVEQRQILLQKAIDEDEFYLRQLRELDAAERQLIKVVSAYDDFLNEQLWWLRAAEPTRLQDLGKLLDEAKQLLSPTIWSDLGRSFYDQVVRNFGFWLALIVAAVVWWKRRTLVAAIEDVEPQLRKLRTDRFSLTLRVLFLTLIIAAPMSLVLGAVGWQLHASSQGTDLTQNLGYSLVRTALLLYILQALRMMFLPRGLATMHFRWPESDVSRLRGELSWMIWISVPAVLLARFAFDLNPVEAGGVTARLGFLIFYAALALILYRLLHPKRGVLAQWLRAHEAGLFTRVYSVCFWLLVLFPLWAVVEMLAGYIYSASNGATMFLGSLWLIICLVLIQALALRWLRVVQRRLAYEAAIERRKAALASRQAEQPGAGSEASGELQIEEPKVDLTELSDDSRRLVNIAVVFTGLVGLYLIWSPLFPALRVFDEVVLWYQTVTVDGETKRLPITLADIGLAAIYALGTAVIARRLPAVLEIILLQGSSISEGDRYTVTKLTTYIIVAIGIFLVLGALGAQWSQLQWLVAALGVGIGFGLQEIVANFISGLIILFERPVRVGDVVTIGNTSGVVTKVRIRATTIRDWTRKELLVPNKDLITGQVLNWSLSDEMLRISIVVGVAYGTDVSKALALMKEAAEEDEHVLTNPAPLLSFDSFGDNALTLTLRAYLTHIDYLIQATTDLHTAIMHKFEAASIEIAFPQRDVHLDTLGPLRVHIEKAPQQNLKGNDLE